LRANLILLAKLAKQDGFEALAFLLDMAVLEATERVASQ